MNVNRILKLAAVNLIAYSIIFLFGLTTALYVPYDNYFEQILIDLFLGFDLFEVFFYLINIGFTIFWVILIIRNNHNTRFISVLAVLNVLLGIFFFALLSPLAIDKGIEVAIYVTYIVTGLNAIFGVGYLQS